MKKLLLLLTLILVLSSLILVSCGGTDSDTSNQNGTSDTTPGGTDKPVHTHTPDEAVRENEKAATCKDAGSYDEVVYCSDCGEEISRTEKAIPKLTSHTFDGGTCSVCGTPKPSEGLLFTAITKDTCYLSGIGYCNDKNLVIPEVSPTGYKVVAIGKGALKGQYCFENVVIPSTVKKIGDEAFSYTNLYSIAIPEGVEQIGSYAFYGCTYLESVSLPSSLEVIGDEAFASCSYLEEVIIAEGLKSLGLYTFAYCNHLKTINLPDSLISLGNLAFKNSGMTYTSYEGGKYLGNEKNPHRWLVSVDDSTVTSFTPHPDTAFIAANAFSNHTRLNTIELPAGLIGIDLVAFADCISLKNFTLPESLKYIGQSAFNGCTAIKALNFPASVETIGYRAFYGCTGLEEITFGRGLREIGIEAFKNCSSISSIALPDGLEKLSDEAFCACTALTSVSIPDSITYFGYSVFTNCKNLTKTEEAGAYYIGNEKNPYLILLEAVAKDIPACDVAETTKFIASGAFYECKSLRNVTLPDGLLSVGNSAFFGCVLLEGITLPEGLTYIGSQAFHSCAALPSITIPDSVTHLGDRAFHSCKALREATVGAGVTEFQGYLFDNCPKLTSVTFSDPEGWYSTSDYTSWENRIDGWERDLTVPTDNATNLAGTLKTHLWYKY